VCASSVSLYTLIAYLFYHTVNAESKQWDRTGRTGLQTSEVLSLSYLALSAAAIKEKKSGKGGENGSLWVLPVGGV